MQPPLFVVLPHQGAPWLHRPDGANTRPLCPVPTGGRARFCISPDAAWLGVLDEDGRRAHLYRVADDVIECVQPPCALAGGDRGHAIAAAGGVLYVGGSGKSGEMLWALGGPGDALRPMPIPQKARRAGKAVDAVFVHEGRLLAIDDIVFPKWGFIHDLADPAAPRLAAVVDLPWHTSYEHVRAAAIGQPGVMLLSTGINHGTSSAHFSLLDLHTLREIAAGSWVCESVRDSAIRIVLDNLFGARALVMLGDRTLFAGHGPVLWGATGIGPVVRTRFADCASPRVEIVPVTTTRFAKIQDIAPAGGSGVYVTGTLPHGVFDWEFVNVGASAQER